MRQKEAHVMCIEAHTIFAFLALTLLSAHSLFKYFFRLLLITIIVLKIVNTPLSVITKMFFCVCKFRGRYCKYNFLETAKFYIYLLK